MDGCIPCLRCDLTLLSTDTTALLSDRTGTTVRKDTDLGELKLPETHSLPEPSANRIEAVGRATAAERYRTAGSRKDQRWWIFQSANSLAEALKSGKALIRLWQEETTKGINLQNELLFCVPTCKRSC